MARRRDDDYDDRDDDYDDDYEDRPSRGGGGRGAPPPNYLVPSIIVTLCCCLIGGIIAIVNASQVNSKWAAGDYAGARKASEQAKLWCMISAGVGIVVNIIAFGAQIALQQR